MTADDSVIKTEKCHSPTCISCYPKSKIKPNDPVKHPNHYTSHPSGIECIEIVKHMNFPLGSAIKYIWRCDDKGNPIEDLRKAIEYIEIEIARRENESPNL